MLNTMLSPTKLHNILYSICKYIYMGPLGTYRPPGPLWASWAFVNPLGPNGP